MKACIQRVRRAEVTVAGEVCGQIGRGMLVLLGVAADDTEADARWLAKKISGLRIFEDSQEKMNLSLTDVGGAMLVVSQFTLLGDCRHGRRPDFIAAASSETAEKLYQSLSMPSSKKACPWPQADSGNTWMWNWSTTAP